MEQFYLRKNEQLPENIPWSYFTHYWTISTIAQRISLDDIKAAAGTGIRKCNKRSDLNAIHHHFMKKFEINLTEDDITSKITFKADSFYFTKILMILLKLLKILLNVSMKMLKIRTL